MRNAASQRLKGDTAPPGGGGPNQGTPADNGAGNQGPSLPNGDSPVGTDIWHPSVGCPNCGVIWGQSQDFVYDFMKNQAIEAAGGAVFESLAAARYASKAVNEGIYEFTAHTGETYVGQSGNISSRLARHISSGKLLPQNFGTVRTTEVLGGRLAREVAEQLRIDELGGIGNLANKLNPIRNGAARLLNALMMEF